MARSNLSVGRMAMIAAMVTIPILVIGAAVWAVTTQIPSIGIVRDTYCYPQERQEQVAFLVDASFTTVTSDQQDRGLRNAMLREYTALRGNGKIRIFSTGRGVGGAYAEPVIEMCRPSTDPAEQARISGEQESNVRVQRRFEDAKAAFVRKVDKLLTDLKDPNKSAIDSPILEQTRDISAYPFEGPLERFVLFSDGIQNSDLWQFCIVRGHLPSFAKFAQHPNYELVRPRSLKGVSVQILLVESLRLPSGDLKFCTNREVRSFWISFFKAAGASVLPLKRLRYGGVE